MKKKVLIRVINSQSTTLSRGVEGHFERFGVLIKKGFQCWYPRAGGSAVMGTCSPGH